jgi:hypothetical protein
MEHQLKQFTLIFLLLKLKATIKKKFQFDGKKGLTNHFKKF